MDKKKALKASRLLQEIDDLEWKESWLRTGGIDKIKISFLHLGTRDFDEYSKEIRSFLLNLVTKELEQLNKQLEEL